MTDQTGNDPGATIYNFPRLGFNLTPTNTPSGTVIEPPNTPTPQPQTAPTNGRRSPLDTLAALPDPGILQPPITPPAAPAPGHVPATFRSEPAGDLIGPRLGALSLAACLAVAVAALRGTHTVLSTWWENRLARQAETAQLREARLKHQLAMQNIGDKVAQQRAKTNNKVPSSSEFGRKTLGNRSSGGQGGAGKGPGRKGPGTGGSGSSSSGAGSKTTRPGPSRGPKRTNSGTDRSPSGGGKGSQRRNGKGSLKNQPGSGKDHGILRKDKNAGGSKRKPLGPANSGSGSGAGKNNRPGGDGKGRRTLPQAAGTQMNKAAARRLKRRRKDLDTPAVWSDKKNRKNSKGPSADTKTPVKQRPQLEAGKDTPRKNDGRRKDRKGTDRTTLAEAMGRGAYKAARRRLKKRRRTVTPPIWSAPRNRKTTPGPTPGPAGGPGTTKTKTRGSQDNKTRQRRSDQANAWWARARSYVRDKANRGGCFGGTTNGPQTGAGGAAGQQPGPNAGGPQGQRRSPFENAGQAGPQTQWTVEREDYPGAQAKTWQPDALTTGQPALEPAAPAATDPAPAPNTHPGTPGPHTPAGHTIQEKRSMLKPPGTGGYSMSAEHATEITLDDSLDEAEGFAKDAFKTHDECGRLAKKAHALRLACIQLSEELATKHNLIGRLFQGALARFIESMDLVDRMAQEMELSSLEAAEMAEALSNDLEDAYRPYTQATADAGLTTPSAPIHNRV